MVSLIFFVSNDKFLRNMMVPNRHFFRQEGSFIMAAFFSWFYIPFITILLPGRTGWFSSNFSTAAAQGSSRLFLILWGISIILFFHLMMKEILNQDAQSPQKARLLFLTDLAAWMLLLSVFLPYMPGDRPIISVFHTSLAFCAALLFFLVLLALDLKYYLSEPERFSRLTAALLGSCLMAFLLFLLSGFLISSALEIFCTVFAAQWLYFFYRKTKRAAP